MKFEPQCKTLAELHRKWADVIEMCEGTEARPEDGWKIGGDKGRCTPTLASEPHMYEFSIGIADGKHVFRGDTLCCEGKAVIVIGHGTSGSKEYFSFVVEGNTSIDSRHISFFSCNPPKQEPIIPEDFTPWHDGEWTGHPLDEVTVIFAQSMRKYSGSSAKDWAWNRLNTEAHGMEIIAYKITKKYQPETVMVELPYDIAKHAAGLRPDISPAITEACRKALEREKLL